MANELTYSHLKSTKSSMKTLNLALSDKYLASTVSDEYLIDDIAEISMTVVSSATATGGVITLEGSPTAAYSGTWLSLGTVTISAASTVAGLTVSAVSTNGLAACRYVRARISTVVSGPGTCKVYLALIER